MALVETEYIDPTKLQGAQATNAYAYLAQANQAATAAQQARTQSAVEGLQGQVPTIHEDYDALARQSYQGLMGQQRGAANQLASQGLYNSGYADTYKTMQQTAYGSQVNAQELERQRQLRALEQQIAEARMSGDAALGDLQSQNAYQMAQQMNADRAFQLQNDQFAYQKQQAAAARQLQQLQQEKGQPKNLDRMQAEQGILLARQYIQGAATDKNAVNKALDLLNNTSMQEWISQKYGADAYEAYKETLLAELPGMSANPIQAFDPLANNEESWIKGALSQGSLQSAWAWLRAVSEDPKYRINKDEIAAVSDYLQKYGSSAWGKPQGYPASTINRFVAANAGYKGYGNSEY